MVRVPLWANSRSSAAAGVSSIGYQPISLTRFGYTRAPRVLASSCEPRQTPRKGRSHGQRLLDPLHVERQERILIDLVDVHRAAQRDQPRRLIERQPSGNFLVEVE